MMKDDRTFQLIMQLTNSVSLNERKSIVEAGDVNIHSSEMHLMLLIEEGKNTNATRIAEYLGITKGAVSQNLNRLEQKGVLIKEKDPYNKNELMISFTPLGKVALRTINERKQSIVRKLEPFFQSLNEDEKAIVDLFLAHLIRVIGAD